MRKRERERRRSTIELLGRDDLLGGKNAVKVQTRPMLVVGPQRPVFPLTPTKSIIINEIRVMKGRI